MIHLLLDAARMESAIYQARDMNSKHVSLYKGKSMEALADFAPYLFDFSAEEAFQSWFWEAGWGNAWGVLVDLTAPKAEVYRHFRKFLLVHNEEGEQVYFRFYDPRVLRVFLSTCNREQLREFFGPVRYFLIEDIDAGTGTYYWISDGELKKKTVSQTELKQPAPPNP